MFDLIICSPPSVRLGNSHAILGKRLSTVQPSSNMSITTGRVVANNAAPPRTSSDLSHPVLHDPERR